MLLKKTLIDQVCIFKTFVGTEFVGEIVSETDTSFTIKQPIGLTPVKTATGLSLQYTPLLFSFDPENLEVYKTSLLFAPIPCTENMIKEYRSATSGIEIASSLPTR